jgi:integrase
LHRTPQKESAQSRKDDLRRAELWTRLYGDRLVAELGDVEWNEFRVLRAGGAIDARGRVVPDGRDDRGEPSRRPVGARAVDADLVFLIAVFNWAMGFKVKGRRLLEHNPFGAPAPGVKRTLERPKNRAPRKPIATYDRFLKVRAAAERVWMECRKGEPGAELLDRRPEGSATAVMKWMKPSYLPELLDLVEATGRRISAICRLWYSDFVRQGGVVTAVRWRPFKREDEQIVPLSDRGQAAVARILAQRPGLGDVPVFPANRGKGKAIGKRTATDWLSEAERVAGVEHLAGGSFHPYRRKWATERKHLPTVDVMLAGGWKDDRSLKGSYQLADDATVIAVVNEPRKLVEKKA